MDKKDETIIEHLTELRKRLLFCLLFFLTCFALSLFWSADIYRLLTSQFDYKLLVLGPDDILWIYLSLASLSAVCLSVPFITFQIWAFVRPALKDREARALLAYIPAVFICFIAGLSFGFFLVTPALLSVLLGFGDGLFETQLTAQNYLLFVFHTTVPLAVLFEFPVVVAFLTAIRLISSAFLRKYRRYAYFILIVIAVILTPADLVSDLLMALPLLLIYEISVTISRFIEKKRRK
ncbi:twin-arginine translocase subunit TatC [Streptococcus saliviloxodontae]|uniref:Sec-independent protein translocase protein TatC n=1 Tax=Streptococcus saliviloxodontae TaxID=1349416 RepID=A0ABS2PMK2_9STRE|nr:twin-arginine translocase subunit TatC [Streptococcus saliviloxodontae]MBM7636507.1 sec-independent protein translocase protein TatC [Streptococcus saliviloxodontae]